MAALITPADVPVRGWLPEGVVTERKMAEGVGAGHIKLKETPAQVRNFKRGNEPTELQYRITLFGFMP